MMVVLISLCFIQQKKINALQLQNQQNEYELIHTRQQVRELEDELNAMLRVLSQPDSNVVAQPPSLKLERPLEPQLK